MAAPTMLLVASVDGALHADGGTFANAPDLLALELAIRSGAPAPEISMLSIGSMNACPLLWGIPGP